ncbi:MAG: hypothetical protein FRX49_12891 [Trebouxia sp. A1-2]|nr:MAG: hypothetical protein FRX49_12891 [Trebouxia sp. A1-2]
MYHDVLRDDNVEAAPWEHYSSYKFAKLALQALPSPKQNTLVGQPTGFEHPAPNTGRTVYLLKLQNASAITVLCPHAMTAVTVSQGEATKVPIRTAGRTPREWKLLLGWRFRRGARQLASGREWGILDVWRRQAEALLLPDPWGSLGGACPSVELRKEKLENPKGFGLASTAPGLLTVSQLGPLAAA